MKFATENDIDPGEVLFCPLVQVRLHFRPRTQLQSETLIERRMHAYAPSPLLARNEQSRLPFRLFS